MADHLFQNFISNTEINQQNLIAKAFEKILLFIVK